MQDLEIHGFRRLRRWCERPVRSSSGCNSKASATRSRVIMVIGRPASIICQWRTLNPYESMSSWLSFRSCLYDLMR